MSNFVILYRKCPKKDPKNPLKRIRDRAGVVTYSCFYSLNYFLLQVYNRVNKQICYLDKYYGRKLDRKGLLRTLREFFHNGLRTRHELMWPIIARLREIRDSLERLRSYRFYSSSLLVIYEGDPSADPTETKFQSEEEGPSTVKLTTPKEKSSSDPENPNTRRTASADKLIDVRMVDFAKSTNQDLDSSFKHDGPDHGYIFGLENLIKLLQEIALSSCPNGGYEGDTVAPSSDTHLTDQ